MLCTGTNSTASSIFSAFAMRVGVSGLKALNSDPACQRRFVVSIIISITE